MSSSNEIKKDKTIEKKVYPKENPFDRYHSIYKKEFSTVKYNINEPHQILDFLYIGSAEAAVNLKRLEELDIYNIINCAQIPKKHLERKNMVVYGKHLYDETKYKYLGFLAMDREDYDISKFFDQTNNFLKEVEKTGGKVLVHCISGISRSTAVVCAYLIMEKNYSPEDAFHLVVKQYFKANPNPGFVSILQDL
eukprot:gene6887-11049_t